MATDTGSGGHLVDVVTDDTGASSRKLVVRVDGIGGSAAPGQAPTDNPQLIAGTDGTLTRTVRTDPTGKIGVYIGANNGANVGVNTPSVDSAALPLCFDTRAWGMVLNGAGTGDRLRTANSADGTAGTGILAVGALGVNTSTGTYIRNKTNPSGHAMVSLGLQTGVTDVPVGQMALTVTDQNQPSTVGVLGYLFDGNQQRYLRDVGTASGSAGTGLLGAGVLGRYTAAIPNFTDGQYGALSMNTRGQLAVAAGASAAQTGSFTAYNFLAGIDGTTRPLGVASHYTDGTTTVATRGDTTGAYVHAPPSVPASLSGSIAASGGTATVAFTSTSQVEVMNPSTATLWASWGAPAVNGAGSFPIAPGGSFSKDRVNGTLTLLSTAANQPFTAYRYS